jgi:DNA-binding LacI/PurR family transcriptional regulator
MSDIAQRAGVSKVTVSAVLSATSGNNTRVAEATRQRILDAARELNYSPNGIAKMFRHRSTDIVGLYLGDWLLSTHNLFLAEIVSGLQIGCHEHRKDLLIHSTFRGQDVNDIYLELISRKIDGLIMFALESDPLAIRLSSSSLPVVAIADAVSTLPSVVADDCRGSQLAAKHLADKGHSHILYRRGWSLQASANRRYIAFVEAAAAYGMKVSVDVTPRSQFGLVMTDEEVEILNRLAPARPSAIVCPNDYLAYAAVDYCKDNGFKIPDDISIVGFDGLVTEIRPATRLTTIKAPWAEVAQTAIGLVVKSLAGETIPLETILPVELMLGDTT